MLSVAFETNCKSLRGELGPIEELSMLKLVHSIEAVRDRITLTYRGYVLELTSSGAGWQVEVYPQRSDLPILSRADFMARDKDVIVE